jgi:cytochrome c oxidase subunit 4
MSAHALTLRSTLAVGAALIALWVLSWALSYVSLGAWSLVVALVIAAAKALLVALFFMELVVEKPSFNLAIGAALVLTAILIALTVADVATRGRTFRMPPRATHPTEGMESM